MPADPLPGASCNQTQFGYGGDPYWVGDVWWNGQPTCGQKSCSQYINAQQKLKDISDPEYCVVDPTREVGCYCPVGYAVDVWS